MNFRSIVLRVATRLLMAALDQAFKSALPAIYRRLDSELPYWLQQPAAARNVEHAIAQATSDALGRSPKPFELNLVRLLYDPVAAAQNLVTIRLRQEGNTP